jgi:hypothetical protein
VLWAFFVFFVFFVSSWFNYLSHTPPLYKNRCNVNHVPAALSYGWSNIRQGSDLGFHQSALRIRYVAGDREARCESAAALATVIGNENHTKATVRLEWEGVESRLKISNLKF